jgi:serine/threonine-protein kinase
MSSIYDYEPLFGEWKIGKRLGKGGFGEVYSIYKEAFGITQWAAVKRIELPHNNPEKDNVLLERVKAEIMSMIQMKDYPHIVKIEDFAVVDWKRDEGQDILIRMELLTSLEEKLKDGPLSVDEIVKMGIHLCKMLEVCEQQNIIHRDIKPANIFITKYGDYKLGDFGIARTLSDGVASTGIGTLDYMAPEVIRGKYDGRVDIYSLGVTMYYLLNGNKLPF